jgi:hypothetical protein
MASACDFPPPTWLFGKKEELMAAKGKFAALILMWVGITRGGNQISFRCD